MVVIDASVAVKWIIDEPGSAKARAYLLHGEGGLGETLLAPALLLVETYYAIAKRYLRGEATLQQLTGAIPALSRVFGTFAPLDAELAAEAAAISFPPESAAANMPVRPFGLYDCIYIALAKRMAARLITADQKQASFAQSVQVQVHSISSAA